MRPDQLGDVLQFPIDRDIWGCWLRFCVVRGTLLKRVVTGGLTVDLPVCGAEVEIYEVDPIWIILPKIPDLVIDRIRDLIRKPWPPPPPEERFPNGVPFLRCRRVLDRIRHRSSVPSTSGRPLPPRAE